MSDVIQIPVGVGATLLVAFLGLVFAFGRVLLSQFEKRMDERAKAAQELREKETQGIDESMQQLRERISFENGRISTLTEKLETFMSTLPLEYVRREDWIRFSATIDTKLDRLADMFLRAIGGNK